jgi:hypothetical protein
MHEPKGELMTKTEVKIWVKRMQEVLRLQDWQLTMVPIGDNTVGTDNCAGHATADVLYESATIRLAMDLDDKLIAQTIIHEILHCLFARLSQFLDVLELSPTLEKLRRKHIEEILNRLDAAFFELLTEQGE